MTGCRNFIVLLQELKSVAFWVCLSSLLCRMSNGMELELSNNENTALPLLKDARVAGSRSNFLPYPTSSLSPAFVPNDLTNFRSRGVSETEKRLRAELVELQERYVATIDRFNWNRLVYSADFRFEPILGTVYFLYRASQGLILSMVEPGEWDLEFLGSFRLNTDRCWEAVDIADGICREELFNQ